jgi:hypothetical protein
MSAEVHSDSASTPDPGLVRKQKFTLRWALTLTLVMALVLSFGSNYSRSSNHTRMARDHVRAWTFRLAKDNVPLTIGSSTTQMGNDLLGTWSSYQGKLTTPTGRAIVIDFTSRDRLFDKSDHLVLSAEGKSVTWPIESIDRAQKVDLKAEFPEAFR